MDPNALVQIISESELDASERRELAGVVRRFNERFDATVVLPDPLESAAVASYNTKTAALFYDRVWGARRDVVPDGMSFRSATRVEYVALLWSEVANYLQYNLDPSQKYIDLARHLDQAFVTAAGFNSADKFAFQIDRAIAAAITSDYGRRVIPMFNTAAAQARAYEPGDYSVIAATLNNLAIPVEDSLSWDQVTEIRADPYAKSGFRRLRHWLDGDMAGKPRRYVEDEIAIRLESYDAALKKHGVSAVVGSLAAVLDSKFLVGSSVAALSFTAAGRPELGLLAGSVALLGKVALEFASSRVARGAITQEDYPEVAFIVEMRRRAGS